MPADVRDFCLPDLGEGLTEGEILQWLVAVGDRVAVDQPVAEVSTEKAAVQVPTPFGGIVTTLHGQPGDVIAVGEPLISVDVGEPAEAASPPGATDIKEQTSGQAADSGASGNVLVGYGTSGGQRRRRRVTVPARPSPATPARATATGAHSRRPAVPVAASPLVRRLAAEQGVDLNQVSGSGPGGSVTRANLESFQAGAPVAGAAHDPDRESEGRRVPLRGARRLTAERLSRSHTEVPAASAWLSVDATGLLELRDIINARQQAVHVTPLAVLLRLCTAALRRFPLLNASFDTECSEIVMSPAVHLGVAVQTESGLLVPVIRDAESRSTIAIAAELERLATGARNGGLAAAELRQSTFTVSNYGAFGVDGGIAIINPPEAAILGVGRIALRPWTVDGAVVARSVLQLSLAFDHRVCDGGDAAGFLRLLGDYVERPQLVLADG